MREDDCVDADCVPIEEFAPAPVECKGNDCVVLEPGKTYTGRDVKQLLEKYEMNEVEIKPCDDGEARDVQKLNEALTWLQNLDPSLRIEHLPDGSIKIKQQIHNIIHNRTSRMIRRFLVEEGKLRRLEEFPRPQPQVSTIPRFIIEEGKAPRRVLAESSSSSNLTQSVYILALFMIFIMF